VNIAVNTRLLLKGKLEGIGWFTKESLERIAKAHPEHTFHFYFDRPFAEEFIFHSNVVPHVLYPQARHPYLWYMFFEWAIPYMNNKIKADMFLSTDGYYSLSTETKGVNVIHDINFEHRPQDLPPRVARYYQKNFPQFAHKANRIATVSEYSKQDIVTTYGVAPEKVDVVYNGCNSIYLPLSESEKNLVKQKYTLGKDYFIYVGSLHARKNILNLLQAFNSFKLATGYSTKLVLVGSAMWDNQEIQKTYSGLAYKQDILFLGRTSLEELHRLVGAAVALSFVPYFEGFGIPVIEAMQSGTPVIVSDVTSLPEVAGDAAWYVNPDSIEGIAVAMKGMVDSTEIREKYIQAGLVQCQKFSWDKTASALWSSIEKVLYSY
jgi:glycosyltransferase involved in cell wall biosynthesis